MPFLWAALGAIVTAYFGERWGAGVARKALLASYIPMARDPQLAYAYAHSLGLLGDPCRMYMFQRLLDEVRAEMAAGTISFTLDEEQQHDSRRRLTVDLIQRPPPLDVRCLHPYAT